MRALDPREAAELAPRPGAKRIHEWDDWLQLAASGTAVLLVRGEDFTCTPRSMAQQAYAAGAASVGVIASTTSNGDGAEGVLLHAHERE